MAFVGSPLLYITSAHLPDPMSLGSDHSWAKQAVSEEDIPLSCPFSVRATLPKGLLVEESHTQTQPEDIHMHLCFH